MVRNHEKKVYILKEKRKPNKFIVVFLSILGFVAIYVPFFGSNLRYMTGTTFKLIFNYLGTFCLIIGGALLAVNILKIFMKKIDIKGFLASVLLLWIGAFLTGVPFEIMGFLFGGTQPPQGYH
jgi:peptidoglycan/LPS O-acetylase OafA/YrhL